MNIFSIADFGAVADGVTDDAVALQAAIDAAHAVGGGRVVIRSGQSVVAGSFHLKSGIDFHLEAGAKLLSATGLEAFPQRVFDSGEEAEKRLWIGAKDAENITLSGLGTIDGRCLAFALGEKEHIFSPTLPWRPAMTCFENVRNLTVRDLTFRDAANWTLHFCGCEDVVVEDVKIFNNLKFPNADGVDPDHCRRVRISGCHIVSADDCIVLKNTAPFACYGPCEDIKISNCRLESRSAAIKIGSESHEDFRRVRISDCVIERSNRGVAIQLRDGGSVEDVEFRNLRVHTCRYSPDWWGAAEAISITALPRTPHTRVGRIQNIRFENIHCEGENGVVIYGDPGERIEGLEFQKLHVGIRKETDWPIGVLDVRPFQGGYRPRGGPSIGEETPWGYPVACEPAVFFVGGASQVHFHEVTYAVSTKDRTTWRPIVTDDSMLAESLEIRERSLSI